MVALCHFLSERPRFSRARFVLLGAGFIRVETRAITELGLMFGSTYGAAIVGDLLVRGRSD